MLLEFRVSNYKSFKDEMFFSIVPESQQKGLDYSILQESIGKKKYKALCSAVIYGPNASGKTNIIGAMDTFRRSFRSLRTGWIINSNALCYFTKDEGSDATLCSVFGDANMHMGQLGHIDMNAVQKNDAERK